MYSLLNSVYGQVRGYGRWRIRRRVARNASKGPEELKAEAWSLFRQRVCDAVRRFPLYADKVREFRGRLPTPGEGIAPQELPVWSRQDQRLLFESLGRPPIAGSFRHSTGGSTGMPLHFYMTRESYEWRAAVADRGYSWAGGQEGRKSYYVWGTPIQPLRGMARWKAGFHHWLQRRRYFDSFHFDDEQKARCCEGINRYRPPVLVGYVGNLVELARFARDNSGALKWKASTLITAAEGLHPGQRDLLQRWLADEVFVSYGSREFMLIGMECSRHCGYHIASDNLFVEIVDDDGRPLSPGRSGRLLITDLRNPATPFIRYEIGDSGSVAEDPCDCGLPFPLLASVDGRVQEVIYDPRGAKLTALFIPHLMKEFPWVDGYQIVQERKDALTVNLVSRQALSDAMTRPIADALRDKVGDDMTISFARVGSLKKNASGKTPIVISRMGGK